MSRKYLVLFFMSMLFKQSLFQDVKLISHEEALKKLREVDDQYVNGTIKPYPKILRDSKGTTMKYLQATLKNMNLTMACSQCPQVYLPVCTKKGEKYTTYKNRCLFRCNNQTDAKEIRRGICIYW
ncbi:uncharacterized protein LOC125235238 [Leguminivora glycinivorella]|uniref:uncharacterized protein LOC125235238 n=1 Tax=Leguminivora glycinivorella TaxID=1035111 RepID=UPI00201099CD|nr:uncharacterized protein LOC125235238 [Leguminivora glycinivorella]